MSTRRIYICILIPTRERGLPNREAVPGFFLKPLHMQKVITVLTYFAAPEQGKKHLINQYPELDELLDQGFKVCSVTPAVYTGATVYSLTFVLEIEDKPSSRPRSVRASSF